MAAPIIKWSVLLAGFAYTGLATRLFEQKFGWHLVPIGVLMLFGSLFLAQWAERLFGSPKE